MNACLLCLAIALAITSPAGGTTLQEQIDAAARGDTIRVEAGMHDRPDRDQQAADTYR